MDDFDIPLLLSHTVVKIFGKQRLEGVLIAKVDENRNPIKETEEYVSCDTLLLSVGLIPENELSKQANIEISNITGGPYVNESLQTNIEGIFACGNALHVHDLVDYVSEESELAGKKASSYLVESGEWKVESGKAEIRVGCGFGVRYAVPVKIDRENVQDKIDIRFRVGGVYKNADVCVYLGDVLEYRKRALILTPGEMETVTIKKEAFYKYDGLKEVTVRIEERGQKEIGEREGEEQKENRVRGERYE